MIYSPIWKDIEFKSSASTLDYLIRDDESEIVHTGYANRMPDQTGVTININNRVEELLGPDFDLDIREADDDVIANGRAYRAFGIGSGSTELETYGFLYDWSYEDYKWTGQTGYMMSEPINGHLDPRMRSVFTLYNSAETSFNWDLDYDIKLDINPNILTFHFTGGSITVTVTTNTCWEITSMPDWLTASTLTGECGTYDHVTVTRIVFTAPDNTGGNDRAGSVVFSTPQGDVSIPATQYQDFNVLIVSPDSFNISGYEYDSTISIQTEGIWYVVSKPDWVSFPSSGRSGTFPVHIEPNISLEQQSRRGSIVIANYYGRSATVSINQGYIYPDLIVTPTHIDCDYYASSYTLTIISQLPWTITQKPDWVTIPMSGPTGTSTVQLSVTENEEFGYRNGTVTVSNGHKSVDVTLTQDYFEGLITINYIPGGVPTYTRLAMNINGFTSMQIGSNVPTTPAYFGNISDPVVIKWRVPHGSTVPPMFYAIRNSYRAPSLREVIFRCSSIPQEFAYVFDDGDLQNFTAITFTEAFTSSIIPYAAFANCRHIETVDIPECVQTIDYRAFEGCTGLTYASIPSGVTTIGIEAFEECTSLDGVVLPEGLQMLRERAFKSCSSLSEIDVPTGLTVIGSYVFADCTSLTEATLDLSTPAIYKDDLSYDTQTANGIYINGRALYSGCTSITKVTITGEYSGSSSQQFAFLMDTFDGCTSLTDIVFDTQQPITLNGTFGNCTSLTDVTIPDNVTLADATFAHCTSLTGVTISEGVIYDGGASSVHMNTGMFRGCTSLADITIPYSMNVIGGSMFQDCTALTSITLTSGVTEIGGGAFWNTGFSELDVSMTRATAIPADFARACTNLRVVKMPATTTSVGNSAFYLCGNLIAVYCYAVNVPTLKDDWNFYGVPDYGRLFVPSGQTTAYASQWIYQSGGSGQNKKLPQNWLAVAINA